MRVSISGSNVNVKYGFFKTVSINPKEPVSRLNGMRTWRVRQLLGEIKKLPNNSSVQAIKGNVSDNLKLREKIREEGPIVAFESNAMRLITLRKGAVYEVSNVDNNTPGLSAKDWNALVSATRIETNKLRIKIYGLQLESKRLERELDMPDTYLEREITEFIRSERNTITYECMIKCQTENIDLNRKMMFLTAVGFATLSAAAKRASKPAFAP